MLTYIYLNVDDSRLTSSMPQQKLKLQIPLNCALIPENVVAFKAVEVNWFPFTYILDKFNNKLNSSMADQRLFLYRSSGMSVIWTVITYWRVKSEDINYFVISTFLDKIQLFCYTIPCTGGYCAVVMSMENNVLEELAFT